MKRISKKNQYISDLVWEKDHFETELKRVKPYLETGKFPWILYLGNQFTISQAKARVKELTAEIEHVQSDPSYTPWKDDFNFEKHTIEDIKRNLHEQEIPDCSPAGEPVRGQGVHPSMYEAWCPGCDKITSDWAPESGSGVCENCEEEGKWTDVNGTLHIDDEEDLS